MKKYLLVALTLSLLVAAVPPPALAQCANPPCGVPDAGNTILAQGGNGISGGVALVQKITDWMFTILLVLAVVFILFAAFKYLFAGGDSEAVGTAHKMLIYAVVAIAVAFLAKGIVFVVQQLVTSGYSGGSSSGCNLGGSINSNGQWQVNAGIGSGC